jgi:hypothetical protein
VRHALVGGGGVTAAEDSGAGVDATATSREVVPDTSRPATTLAAASDAGVAWTPERRELNTWFQRNAPSLGELYEGAVIMLYGSGRPLPGWSRFVAHAVREVGNRLPDAVGGRQVAGPLEYATRCESLARRWEELGLPLDGSIPPVGLDSPPASIPDVPLPPEVYRLVTDLVRDHRAVYERQRDKARRFFAKVIPESRGVPSAVQPVIDQWFAIVKWFVRHAHDRLQPDADYDDQLLEDTNA